MTTRLPDVSTFRRYLESRRIYSAGAIALRTALLSCPRELQSRPELIAWICDVGRAADLLAHLRHADAAYRDYLSRTSRRPRGESAGA